MITLEIVFNSSIPIATFSGEHLGIEFSSEIKSDKSPSLWEDELYSKIDGSIVHIFDREFIGKPGYRALFEDIVDGPPLIKFDGPTLREFEMLTRFCLENSSDGSIFVCADYQFGPPPAKMIKAQLYDFLQNLGSQGIRVNSCTEVHA
ncbi:hypothetical protein [Allopontixanthobacter sp.]|uniref:hypothetical protein n=1 Tax=Allopontixanthobacter sp. TaxID=2906452 RepID=UPI002AB93403|nr:hypothetical protein [Allopontixanthobacter sp.]MDZ4306529.1 hypothetical protein [Allopontixanthobacter sp.]